MKWIQIINFEIAKWNTQSYDKVTLCNEAIWINNQTVKYSKSLDFYAYKVSDKENEVHNIEIQGTTIKSMIEKFKLKKIDYLKMDIEGAELKILKSDNLDWLNIVDALNLEVHLEKTDNIETYINIIRNCGFNVWIDTHHWASIMAIRNKQ